MPRERVINGPLWAHFPEGYTEPGDGPNPSARIYRPGDKLPDGTVILSDPGLDIVWRREHQPGAGDGFVQITVECEAEWARRRLAQTSEPNDGRWMQIPLEVMDRRQINQLIRHLKRARDAAYGADE